jgi:hypothetical protein
VGSLASEEAGRNEEAVTTKLPTAACLFRRVDGDEEVLQRVRDVSLLMPLPLPLPVGNGIIAMSNSTMQQSAGPAAASIDRHADGGLQ